MLAATPEYKGRVVLAGNRTGKSEGSIYEAMLAVLGLHPTRDFPKSGKAWIVSLDFNMTESTILPMFEEFMPRHIKERSHWSGKSYCWTIKRPDGGIWKVWFKSSEAGRDKFQSAKLDFIVFDEEPKRTDIFSECEARLIDKAGIWWMAATPLRGTQWLKNLSEREDVFSCTAGMAANPHIPIEEVEKFAASLGSDEERDIRVYGKYIVYGGTPVFPTKPLQKMIDKAERPMPFRLAEVA
jgi:phage terminase large subunit-like protein